MTDTRPDPDTLLERAKLEEKRATQGLLRIYFGASAGVGKTYAMLQSASVLSENGIDVIIGIVETHGRKETEVLLTGREVLPPRIVEHKTTRIREFDLDAALFRRPQLILIDELAHTNAPGSRNLKRWQDVMELLDAGIDVYTTVNVQHVESLNDVVAKITGVIVRETIPDSVVERADEIKLIDLPTEDLLERLKEGKVYRPDLSDWAAQNFFRKGNLAALRELSLRATADRVNKQVLTLKRENSVQETWPTTERFLVCVGASPLSARVVRAARRMAINQRAEWIALNVQTSTPLSDASCKQVAANLSLAQGLGAETITVKGDNIVKQIVDYARERNVSRVIIGKPTHSRWMERLFGSKVDELVRESGDIDVSVIKGDPELDRPQGLFSAVPASDIWKLYCEAAGTVAMCTLACRGMRPYFDSGNLLMVYLLGVVLVSACLGRGPSIFASVLSVAAFDYFFVEPHSAFYVFNSRDLVTLLVMLTVGILFSALPGEIQRQADAARQRERRTAALYSMSREMAHARGSTHLLEIAVMHISGVLEADVIGLLPDKIGKLKIVAKSSDAFPFTGNEQGVALWAFDVGHMAGKSTDTLPGAQATYLPLNGKHGPVGVIGVHQMKPLHSFYFEQMQLLDAFATQAALAIEVDNLTERSKQLEIGARLTPEATSC